MTITNIGERNARSGSDLNLTADVLVIGGGPAGIWAALTAAQNGAQAVIVEKGYVGTSGPFSSANTGIYYIKPDDPIHREGTVEARLPLAFDLADKVWIERTFDQSFANLDAMAHWGYKWPKNEEGKEHRGRLRGPDVLYFLRNQLVRHGVRILDHSPALELLVDDDGVVAGAAGVNRQTGDSWEVKAAATVLATGGTAFLSNIAGGRGNTGDGYLFAAEAGAEFSGMEFSSQYAPSPAAGVLSRGAHLPYGTLYDDNGQEITRGRLTVKAIEETGKAWAFLNRVKDEETKAMLRKTHAHIFLHLDRLGHKPFDERYQLDFRLEGTIRAAGGIAIDDDLSSTAPGLFIAGDLATREKVTGAGPPGGGPAASWAFASGTFAGKSAVSFARRFAGPLASRQVKRIGEAGLRPAGKPRDLVLKDFIASVQSEMIPFDRNYWRSGPNLAASLERFGREWSDLRDGLAPAAAEDARGSARAALRARETAALLATARWINVSALERTETRGLHRRSDFPNLDPTQTYHLISGGLDDVWVKHREVRHTAREALAS